MSQIDSKIEGEGLFRPRRLGHVNYWVKDVEAVLAFYRDVAGLEEVYRRPPIKGIFLSNGNTYHDTAIFDVDQPQAEGKKRGLHHFAFELETEAEMCEADARIGEFGFEFDNYRSADVAHSCYGRDPDGNRFEVYADIKEKWRDKRSGDIDQPEMNPVWAPGITPPVTEPCYPVDPEIRVVKDAIFHTQRAAHLAIIAEDYKGLYKHYTALVGLTPLVGGLDHDFVLLGGSVGYQNLSIFRRQPTWDAGFHHGGFELADNSAFDRSIRLLGERGFTPERQIDTPARRAVHVLDPSGNRLQFFVNGIAPLSTLAELPIEDVLFLA